MESTISGCLYFHVRLRPDIETPKAECCDTRAVYVVKMNYASVQREHTRGARSKKRIARFRSAGTI